MKNCRNAAQRIIEAINQLLPEQAETDRVLGLMDLYAVQEATKDFETVFSNEAQYIATYFVSKKGIYDTNDLIENADDLFTETAKKHISPRAIYDICEPGKCLAFDLGTAAGFHIARAVEQVYRLYRNAKARAYKKHA